jgi:hypothetical protein
MSARYNAITEWDLAAGLASRTHRSAIRRGMFEVADSRSKSRPLRVPRFFAIGH